MRSVRLSALLLVVALSQSGCANEETSTPLYEPKPLSLDIRFTQEVDTELPMTVIEPNLIKRIVGKIFGWIPIVGDLVEIPIDAAAALIPPLTAVMHPEIPENASLTDPGVLEKIESVVFSSGALKIVPERRRGDDYVPDKCFFQACPEIGFTFIEELRIYLLFDPKGRTAKSKGIPVPRDGAADDDKIQVLLGTATRTTDYDETKQILNFRMSKTNLKPYLEAYGPFTARVVADARIPQRAVYFDGAFKVQLGFNIQ